MYDLFDTNGMPIALYENSLLIFDQFGKYPLDGFNENKRCTKRTRDKKNTHFVASFI